jgi:hypothetical protein
MRYGVEWCWNIQNLNEKVMASNNGVGRLVFIMEQRIYYIPIGKLDLLRERNVFLGIYFGQIPSNSVLLHIQPYWIFL